MKNAGIRARCWLGRIQGALQLVTWQWLTAATDARCENAPKVDIKRPFEIRIVAKFLTFYGKYGHFPHRFTHFFCCGGRLRTFWHSFRKKRNITL